MCNLENSNEGFLDQNWTRYSLLVAAGIFIGGITLAWLVGQGFLGDILPNAGILLGVSVTVATVLVCCVTSGMITTLFRRMPQYQEMEIQFDKAMVHYEREEWDEALQELNDLLEPGMDHKRALYYGARCYERKDNWEKVKEYCQHYLDMKPDDKEVWELLALAHKRLFEYDEAEKARNKAAQIESDKYAD